jgi:hypothetical protein
MAVLEIGERGEVMILSSTRRGDESAFRDMGDGKLRSTDLSGRFKASGRTLRACEELEPPELLGDEIGLFRSSSVERDRAAAFPVCLRALIDAVRTCIRDPSMDLGVEDPDVMELLECAPLCSPREEIDLDKFS